MAVLVWDQPVERFFKTGVDHGVMFLKDGTFAAWNGLTSIEDTSNAELKSFYLDGVKYLDTIIPGDFTGKLTAFTYPDEFDQANGIASVEPGLSFYDQPPKSFNLTYRIRKGNAIEGADHGYELHLLYNLVAVPDSSVFDTVQGDKSDPTEFAWSLTGTPPKLSGHRPTAHISLDSQTSDVDVLVAIENILYGTSTSNPRFPSINEVQGMFGSFGTLIIQDNGDGTWTAIDRANDYISMIDSTTFQIDHADATYSDVSTYDISTTTELTD